MTGEREFTILGIDHIGIATIDLDSGSKFWEIMGMTSSHDDELVQEQGVKIRFFEFEENRAKPRIELLEPTSENTPIGRFISKRGIGIQQVCLEVRGLEKLLEHLKLNGIQLIDDSPKQGANGCMIAFVHPKSAGGVLVELSEQKE